MTDTEHRGALHGTVAHEVLLAAPPDRVFAAFSDFELRQRWFRIPGEPGASRHELDFRPGGGETTSGPLAVGGVVEHVEYRSRFLDIVPAQRIVLTSELVLDGLRRSLSLVTVELSPHADGTRLVYTEQFVFVVLTGDGSADIAEREGSTRLMLNGLAAVVEARPS
ncbi:SRPBCC domain-containing protein [Saccharopolyspora hirsuta]|uniref:Activator of Hsp90 ATPase homologue 1/2-like C-terminal domain-containing protein n=1 Tax=Saccharopolyspora hirsuta TaxID=1837 RepID=A0A5M7C2N6_SACHI|nr:SRPBCC domain-containing protein [Saccharopolyspora hirsuta]KAA5832695.1 hypothetical protein F1721_17080 [Saccharopolyspora hirsuta]